MEARPKTAREIANLPPRPEVLDAAKERGITDVVHFTTTKGAIGILASRAVKSNARAQEDEYVEHVFAPNTKSRERDEEWLDYVNLSIQRINASMFLWSEDQHRGEEVSWVALSFSPEILSHKGVVFTTTNNIYPSCKRSEGLEGFSQMFSDPVIGWYGRRHVRAGKLDSWTTDRQAEVLYPGELSIEHLQRIDVQTEEGLDRIHGMMGGLNLNMDVPVRHAPEVFR